MVIHVWKVWFNRISLAAWNFKELIWGGVIEFNTSLTLIKMLDF